MKKLISKILLISILLSVIPMRVSAGYIPDPQTAYAEEFLEKCQGQEWFIDEIERLLNLQEKTIDTITSKEDLERITVLGFQGKNIEGIIPSAIGEFTNLEELFFANNDLYGEIPKELFDLPHLKNIDLSNNDLSGNISEEIGSLQELEVLLLWNNHFTGNIPSEVGNMNELKNLDLAGNELSGTIPDSLGNLTKLKVLALSNNHFDCEIPESFGKLSDLEVLLAWKCGLNGSIPDEIINDDKLRIIDLSDNSLTGEIPQNIGELTGLEKLSIRNNNIEGSIPASIGELNKLKVFDAASNTITGIIPDDISFVTDLEDLSVNNNRLLGAVPDSFKNMDKLKNVDLSDNTLVGDLPNSLLDKVNDGTEVNVRNNYMAGENLKKIANQEGNFIEQQTNLQYKIYLPEMIHIDLNAQGNIYNLIKNYNAVTNHDSDKLKLSVGRYKFEVSGGDETAIEFMSDDEGWYVRPVKEIKRDEPVAIRVTLIGNENIASSEAEVKITTERLYSGGSGGGSNRGVSQNTGSSHSTHDPYIEGYDDNTVRPDDHISREELAMIIYRIIDDPSKEASVFNTDPFPDVQKKRWSGTAISYVKSQGIIEGDEKGTYRPTESLTRAEFAAIIARYTELELNGTSGFNDSKGHWADEYVKAVNDAEYMVGYDDGTFKPESNITRAEVMTAINRILGRKPNRNDILAKSENPYTDITSSHWAYEQVLEATIFHDYTASETTEIWDKVFANS